MSDSVQRRGGTTAEHSTFTGLIRELTVDIDKHTVVVHDGATPGGFPLATEAKKDASGGYAGLTLFKLNLKNAANTFINFLTNATTASRTWTMPDSDGTIVLDTTLASILRPAGTVLNVETNYNAGSSSTSGTRVALSGSYFNYSPKSTNSKLIISCSFQGGIVGLSATNVYGNFDISENTSQLSGSYVLQAPVSGGGVGVSAPCNITWETTNFSLITRSFALFGFTSNTSAAVTGTSIVITIAEVQA